MSQLPLVSVIIPVYNQVELLDRCLASLRCQQQVRLQTIVVDDASPEDPAPVMRRFPEARFLRALQNVGYASANNLGLAAADGDYVLFLNSDTELPSAAVSQLVQYLGRHPDVGAVTPMHRDPAGGIQRTCFRFPTLKLGFLWDSWMHRLRPEHPLFRWYTMADWDFRTERTVEHAQTSCLLVARQVAARVGGMDPSLVLFYNDTDYCRRIAQFGVSIAYLPSVEIMHYGGASVGTSQLSESRVYGDRYRYYRKWFGWRGAMAIYYSLWSRVLVEAIWEVFHADFRFAAHKLTRGHRLSQHMVRTER